jgi:hypothetical protein
MRPLASSSGGPAARSSLRPASSIRPAMSTGVRGVRPVKAAAAAARPQPSASPTAAALYSEAIIKSTGPQHEIITAVAVISMKDGVVDGHTTVNVLTDAPIWKGTVPVMGRGLSQTGAESLNDAAMGAAHTAMGAAVQGMVEQLEQLFEGAEAGDFLNATSQVRRRG